MFMRYASQSELPFNGIKTAMQARHSFADTSEVMRAGGIRYDPQLHLNESILADEIL